MKHTFLAVLLLLSAGASALTLEQKVSLKAAALAEPSIASCLTNGNDVCVTDWFNADSTFMVWRSKLTKDEVNQNDAFDFTQVDNLTIGKARIWDYLFDNSAKAINPSKLNIRAGIAAAWTGTAAMNNVQSTILSLCKTTATNAQKVLATGVGTVASPGVMVFTGTVSTDDTSSILRD